jgi:hypothetical protein
VRLTRRVALAAVLSILALLGLGLSSAAAATGDRTWTGSIATASGTTSTATATWNTSTHALLLIVRPATLAAGRCVTIYFDWTANGHHDARAVRDCRSGDGTSYHFPDATPGNITGGVEKLGICYGAADERGSCVRHTGEGTPVMDWTPWPNYGRSSPCALSWSRRNSNGTLSHYLDPHSQTSQPVGSAC